MIKHITLIETILYVNDQETSCKFYQNIFRYSMTKLILAKILYGDFNIHYLLGKYNDKFIKDFTEGKENLLFFPKKEIRTFNSSPISDLSENTCIIFTPCFGTFQVLL